MYHFSSAIFRVYCLEGNIETIAVMLVTSCLIPIIVLVFMSWFVKMLFGVKISAPKDMPKRIATKFPGYKKEVSGKLS